MNKQRRLSLVLKYIVLGLLTVVFLFPFVWMIATSLKTNTEALTNPTALLPAVPQWGNYPAVIGALNFWREALNSLIMTLGVTFGQIILAALAGYAFAFRASLSDARRLGRVAEHVQRLDYPQPGESVRHLRVPPVLHHGAEGTG